MLKDVKENKLVINQQVGTLSREIKLYEKKKTNRQFYNGKIRPNKRFFRWALD